MNPRFSDRRTMPLAWALFVVALAIRLVAGSWGLPNDVRNWSLHVDEPVLYMKYAASLKPGEGKFVTAEYSYPTLYPLALRLTGDAVAAMTGVQDPTLAPPGTSQEQLAEMQRAHMTLFHRVGRTLSSLAGAGTCVVLFLLMARFVGIFGGLAGGALLAVSPAHVVLSRFQTVDVAATFFFALAIFWSAKMLEAETKAQLLKSALIAGAICGLAAGTKYTGAAALGALIPALWMRRSLGIGVPAVAALLAAAVAFFISTPGILLAPDSVREGLRLEAAHADQGHGLVFEATPSGYWYHLGNVALTIGLLAAALGGFGLVLAAIRREKWVGLVLAAAIPYYLVVGGAEVKLLRYALPLALAAACGFAYALLVLRKHLPLAAYVVAALCLLGAGGPSSGVFGAVSATAWMLGDDPRDEAGRQLKQVAAQRSDTLVALVQKPWYWTASLDPNLSQMFYFDDAQVQGYLAQTKNPHVIYGAAQRAPDYVVFSDFEVGDVRRLRDVQGLKPGVASYVANQNAFLDQVEAAYVVDRVYGGDAPNSEDLRYIRPKVTVLRRRDLAP